MLTAKARINIHEDQTAVVPVLLPDLADVREFAFRLHATGESWSGEAFGWPAEYNAQRPEGPLGSKMMFTPADFCVGENGVWFFSLMWERGAAAPPTEFLDDSHILATSIKVSPSGEPAPG